MPSLGRVGLLAAIGLAAGLLTSGAVWASELFELVAAGESTLARYGTAGAGDPERQRFARLNRAELAAHMAPLDMDRAPNRLKRARDLDGRIDMTLKPGLAVALLRSAVDRVPGGGYLWSADVLGEGGGSGSFLIEQGQVLGEVRLGGAIFKIEPVAGTLHRITEIDPREIPGDIVVPAPPAGKSPKSRGDGPRSEAPGVAAPEASAAKNKKKKKKRSSTITLLAAYTSKAKSASPNIAPEIRFAVAWANKAFKSSGAKVKLKLLKTMAAKGYNEDSRTYSQNLSDLQGSQVFARVRKIRDKKKADLVALIRQGGEYCGIAFINEPPTAATSERGFSVTSRGVCLPASFAHEIGHNMGLRHDRFVESPTPRSKYNFGYVNALESFRTVMAYRDLCEDLGQVCPRVQYFSTPKETYRGERLGIAKGKPGAADAARQLNQNREAVASYR